MQLSDEQRKGLYGPNYRFAEYARGTVIRFRLNGREEQGVISWVMAPGPRYQGGKDRPIQYVIESVLDTSTGLPAIILATDILPTSR
jgi:hypothetical protein